MAAYGLMFSAGLIVLVAGCVLETPWLSEPQLPPAAARMQQGDSGPPPASRTSFLQQTSRQFPETEDGKVATRIAALVNTTPILEEEVREAAARHLVELQALPEAQRASRYREIRRRELDSIIDRELIIQDMMAKLGSKGRERVLEKVKEAAAKEFDKKVQAMKRAVKDRLNVTGEEDFRALLRSQGMSLEGMRRQNERDFLAMAYVRNRIDPALERVGLAEIRQYYTDHPQEFQTVDKVRWQDIFIDASRFRSRADARQFAEQLAAQARGGADFQKLAMQYDQGDSRYRNGEGYGQRRGEIQPPEIEGHLFHMKDGDVGVLERANGYHVFRLAKRDYAGLMPLDDKLQNTIRNKLRNDVWEREYKQVVAELKRAAIIEILPDG